MTERIEGDATARDHGRTGQRYEQQLAAIFDQLAQANNVVCETMVLLQETGRVTFPVIAIDPKAVPLPGEQQNSDAVLGFPIQVKYISTHILDEAIARCPGFSETLHRIRERVAESISLRLAATILYGIPPDLGLTNLGELCEGISPRLPDQSGIDV